MHSPENEALAVVYAVIFYVSSILLILIGAIVSHVFAKAIKSTRASTKWDQRARILHGWIIFGVIRNLSILNLSFYALFDPSDSSAEARILRDNLPSHAAELILMLCVFLGAPTLVIMWKSFTDSFDIAKADFFTSDGAHGAR